MAPTVIGTVVSTTCVPFAFLLPMAAPAISVSSHGDAASSPPRRGSLRQSRGEEVACAPSSFHGNGAILTGQGVSETFSNGMDGNTSTAPRTTRHETISFATAF